MLHTTQLQSTNTNTTQAMHLTALAAAGSTKRDLPTAGHQPHNHSHSIRHSTPHAVVNKTESSRRPAGSFEHRSAATGAVCAENCGDRRVRPTNGTIYGRRCWYQCMMSSCKATEMVADDVFPSPQHKTHSAKVSLLGKQAAAVKPRLRSRKEAGNGRSTVAQHRC